VTKIEVARAKALTGYEPCSTEEMCVAMGYDQAVVDTLTITLTDLDAILAARGPSESADWVFGLTTAIRALRERLIELGVAVPESSEVAFVDPIERQHVLDALAIARSRCGFDEDDGGYENGWLTGFDAAIETVEGLT
jgi:hypothetical protein